MQKGKNLQFDCQKCKNSVNFSLFDLENSNAFLTCSHCNKKYIFQDATLLRQLKKFEALCKQIWDSEEILGSTSVGIDVGETHVKVPYKLLLTRFNSSLDLIIGDKPISIVFRFEPTLDYTEVNSKIGNLTRRPLNLNQAKAGGVAAELE